MFLRHASYLPIAFSEPPPEVVGKVLMISVVPFDSVLAMAESFEDGLKRGSSPIEEKQNN